jgi:RimJ/RimL family protein N-acetyltransferase
MIRWLNTPQMKLSAERWLVAHIPHIREGGLGEAQYAAVANDVGIMAIVAYHAWDEQAQTMQLTMAADDPRWCGIGTVATLLAYPFVDAGVNKIWTSTPHDNRRAIRLNEGLGLARQAEIPDGYGPGRHAVICGMNRDAWQRSRWRSEWEKA